MTPIRAILRSCTLLATLTLAAGPALADPQTEALVRDLIARIDASAEWDASATAIASENADTIVNGLSIRMPNGKAELKIGRLTLQSVTSAADGSFAIGLALAKGLSGGAPGMTVNAPELRIEALSAMSFAGLNFDEKAPFTSIARFYTRIAQTEFAGVSMPSLIMENTLSSGGGLPTVTTTTYSDFRFGTMKAGVLAAASTGKAESATSDGLVTTFEGVSVKNVSFAAFSHVFDVDSYKDGKGDGRWMPLFEAGTYGKLSIMERGKNAGSIGGIAISGIEVRQTEVPLAQALDAVAEKGKSGGPTDDVVLQNAKAMFGWVKLGNLTLTDMVITPPGGEGKIAGIILDNASADGIGRFAITDASGSGDFPEGMMSFKLTLAELTDFKFPSFDVFGDFIRFDEQKKSGQPIDPALAKRLSGAFLDLYPRFGSIKVEGLSFGFPAMGTLSLQSYGYRTEGPYVGPIAAREEGGFTGLTIPAQLFQLEPDVAQVMTGLGYGDLSFDAKSLGEYAAATGAYRNAFTLTGKDIGALSMNLAFDGITRERIEQVFVPIVEAPPGGGPDEMKIIAALNGLVFTGATLKFEDASLTRRAISFAAKLQGIDERTLIANTTAFLQLGMAQLQHPDFTQKVVSAVGTYLADPKSITVSLNPAAGFGVNDAMSLQAMQPKAIIDRFGITITAN